MTSLTGLMVLGWDSTLLLWLALVGSRRRTQAAPRPPRAAIDDSARAATRRRSATATRRDRDDLRRGARRRRSGRPRGLDRCGASHRSHPVATGGDPARHGGVRPVPEPGRGAPVPPPVIRARAALLLTRPGIPAVVEQIVPLLGDPDPDVRLVACSGLARLATAARRRGADLGPRRPRAAAGADHRAARSAVGGGDDPPHAPRGTLRRPGLSSPASRRAVARPSSTRASRGRWASPAIRAWRDRARRAAAQRTRWRCRISAARALGRVGEPACVPALIARWSRRLAGSRAGREVARGAGGRRRPGAARALPLRPRLVGAGKRGTGAARARRARDRGAPARARARRSPTPLDRAREQLALHAVVEEHAAA